MIILHVLHHQ